MSESLSRHSKLTSDVQLSVTADAFNNHFLPIAHRTIAGQV